MSILVIPLVKKHDCLGPLNEFGQPISTWDAEPGPGSCALRGRSNAGYSGSRDGSWGCPKLAFCGGMLLGAVCAIVAREYYVHGSMDNFLDTFKSLDSLWSSDEDTHVRKVSYNRNEELSRVKTYYDIWR